VVGSDELKDIQVSPPVGDSSFCWFYHARRKHLIKYFVLGYSLCRQTSLCEIDSHFIARLMLRLLGILKYA
jgi:hypothetical protein